MKQYGFYLLSASKLVFSDKRYVFGFLVAAFAIFWLFLYIPIKTIPGNDLAFHLSILTSKDWFLFIALSTLTALSIVMNVYIFKNKHSFSMNKRSVQDGVSMAGQGGTGFLSGIVASVFGSVTCSSCAASIFGFLGVGGVLFLLQYRTFITTAAIILMLVSLYFTSKRVLNACDKCRVVK